MLLLCAQVVMADSGRPDQSRRLKILPRVPAEEVPRGKPRDWLSPDDGKSETGSRGSLYTEVDGAQYVMSKYPVRCKYGVMTVPAR